MERFILYHSRMEDACLKTQRARNRETYKERDLDKETNGKNVNPSIIFLPNGCQRLKQPEIILSGIFLSATKMCPSRGHKICSRISCSKKD